MPLSTEDVLPAVAPRPGKRRPGRELAASSFQALAGPLVTVLHRLRVPPPAVVVVHTAVGLAAALAIGAGSLVAGALLLQLKTLLDGADGQLARASGQVTALGRYLDTEADFLVNAAVFGALAVATGAPWLALAAFCALTLVLSADFNVAALHLEARGTPEPPPRATGRIVEQALARAYAMVFGPQDRLVRAVSGARLRRILADERDPGIRERVSRAYHDDATATIIANVGLSTQYLVLGVCLALDRPEVYLWLVVGSLALLPALQLRRELVARRALSQPGS